MKIGFSTLGCPGWLWREVVSAAKDMGFDGIELRGIGNKIYLPHSRTFAPANCPQIKEELKRLGLEIPCLTTGAFLFAREFQEEAQQEVKDYIELAVLLEVPYIRILLDKEAAPGEVDEKIVEENLQELLPLAAAGNVTLLAETNGIYAESARLKALIEKINHPNLAVLWDVHHPYRFYNEKPQETYANLGPWIRHVHVKDSVLEEGKVKYKMLGYGDVPVKEALEVLAAGGYKGFIVLEWLKRWYDELEEPGIVFAHFLNKIKHMMPEE